jgi:CDP-diacylglycerol--glycerol-3-phosphate 3-phosphatidyltransferase
MVARRLGVATPALRRFDCLADIAFYLGVLCCVSLRHPQVVADYVWPFAGLLLAEAACQTISLARFRHTTATHAYLCKTWAVLLFASAALLLGFGVAGALVQLTLVIGGLAYLDVLLILLLARTNPVDVPSAFHVWCAR